MPPNATEIALRSHLRSHNATVLMASGVALLFSVIGWAILYGASYWLTLFTLTILSSGEDGMPATFNLVFFASAAVLLLAAWIDHRLFPSERAVDERPPIEHLADILFFVPRFTLSCWQSLDALVSLTDAQKGQAAELLDRLREGGKLPLQQLPTTFPDGRSLGKILTVLGIANLITQRRDQGMTWISISPLAPEGFRSPLAMPEDGEDHFAGMKRAKRAERWKSLMPPES